MREKIPTDRMNIRDTKRYKSRKYVDIKHIIMFLVDREGDFAGIVDIDKDKIR